MEYERKDRSPFTFIITLLQLQPPAAPGSKHFHQDCSKLAQRLEWSRRRKCQDPSDLHSLHLCLYAGCSLQLAIPPLVAQLALSFAIVQFPPTFCEIGNVRIQSPRPLHDTTLQVRGCAPPRLPRVLAPAPGPAGGVAGAGGGLGPGPRPQRLAGVQPRLAAGTVQCSTVQYSTVQYNLVHVVKLYDTNLTR